MISRVESAFELANEISEMQKEYDVMKAALENIKKEGGKSGDIAFYALQFVNKIKVVKSA